MESGITISNGVGTVVAVPDDDGIWGIYAGGLTHWIRGDKARAQLERLLDRGWIVVDPTEESDDDQV